MNHTLQLVAGALRSCEPPVEEAEDTEESQALYTGWRQTVIHVSRVLELDAQVNGSEFDAREFRNASGVYV
jgi:hypothetical protein